MHRALVVAAASVLLAGPARAVCAAEMSSGVVTAGADMSAKAESVRVFFQAYPAEEGEKTLAALASAKLPAAEKVKIADTFVRAGGTAVEFNPYLPEAAHYVSAGVLTVSETVAVAQYLWLARRYARAIPLLAETVDRSTCSAALYAAGLYAGKGFTVPQPEKARLAAAGIAPELEKLTASGDRAAALTLVMAATLAPELWSAKAALPALEKMAEGGDVYAQGALAEYYESVGESSGAAKAFALNLAAARGGFPPSEFRLALAYRFGSGVEKNSEQFLFWLQKAAEHGVPFARRCLGELYRDGESVKKDPARAAEWFRRAVMTDDVPARHELGFAYLHGRGVPVNPAEAVACFTVAADAGWTPSMKELGVCYYRGPCRVDRLKSYVWIALAAEFGDTEAASALPEFAAGLDPRQAALAASRVMQNAARIRRNMQAVGAERAARRGAAQKTASPGGGRNDDFRERARPKAAKR